MQADRCRATADDLDDLRDDLYAKWDVEMNRARALQLMRAHSLVQAAQYSLKKAARTIAALEDK